MPRVRAAIESHRSPDALGVSKVGTLAGFQARFKGGIAFWFMAIPPPRPERGNIRDRTLARSIADLQTAINAYLAEHNDNPKPFVWTKSVDAILAKLDRLPVSSV